MAEPRPEPTSESDRDDEAAAASAGDELRAARPPVDRVAMADARARLQQSLFGEATPARLGRYLLLGRIAGGGMGVVYGAYDPELHRKVALKVLHPRQTGVDGAHQRLITEARALAALDHPNVVRVHDVLLEGGEVVIVMELVEGRTLATWERERPRSWRELVPIYVQAGDGLAAAHGVDVIHRDFKPANAIVGDDGRVRVLDFGLARFTGDRAPASAAPGPAAAAEVAPELTATGEVVGTLGYTAPEQLAGEPVTPASDQFSFCVALHRAVEGVAPFAGDDAIGLAASIRGGAVQRADDGRRVPPWLRAAIARGLRADPRSRHASMTALLEVLRRPRGWRRWRGPVAAGLVLLAAAAAVVTARRGDDPVASCASAEAKVDAVWGVADRARVAAAIERHGAAGGAALGARVLAGLDDRARRVRTMRREACVAHRRGEQSAVLLDRRMTCLDRRLGDLAAAVRVLEATDGATVARALEVVAGMPAVSACADAEALLADTAPPATPLARLLAARSSARLSDAAALERAGRTDAAIAAAGEALGVARLAGYPPAIVAALLGQGRIFLFGGKCAQAIAPLAQAEALGFEQHLPEAAFEAAARGLFCRASADTRDAAEAAAHIARLTAEGAAYERASRGLTGHFARPLLLNNLGRLAMVGDDRDAARAHFAAARGARGDDADLDLELIAIDNNLAMLTSDDREREALIRAAWRRLHDRLGPQHPLTQESLKAVAHYVIDPVAARIEAARACELYRSVHPEPVDEWAHCAFHRGFLASEVGDEAEAAAGYREVLAITETATSAGAQDWRQLAIGYLALAGGRLDAARDAFAGLIDRYAASAWWWEATWAAEGHLGVGLAAVAAGDDRGAAPHLDAAIAGFERHVRHNEDVEPRRRLALARHTLAAVLRRRGDRSGRADELAAAARAFYQRASPTAYRARLESP